MDILEHKLGDIHRLPKDSKDRVLEGKIVDSKIVRCAAHREVVELRSNSTMIYERSRD